ncbi:MAG: tetratricopeptide repeat protein [Pseudomonadales bacterium]
MKRALLLAASILVCANSGAQMPGNDELRRIFSKNIELAKTGSSDAEMALCSAYSYGLGTTPDPKQALVFCLRAAKAGAPRAQLLLGDFYLHGAGTETDVPAAMYWYGQAIEGGMTQGHIGLAAIYFDLDNTRGTRNLELAELHANEAAAAGLPMGEMYLGVMYFNGFNLETDEKADIDYAAATLWFEKSAQRGNLISAAYLLSIYASESAHQNSYKAYFWASVLKKHLPDTYPEDIHFEHKTVLTSMQLDAAAEELMRMEQAWQSVVVAAVSI